MRVTSSAELDSRFGDAWLQQTDADARLQLLTALLSRFNHDLRTPLNTILGWTHLLQQGAVDAGRSKHVADVIARNSREQTTLLEDFVDDGRAILGVLKLESRPVSLEATVGAALERIAPLLSLHGVALQSKTAVDEVTVDGDAKRLEKLLVRLLTVVLRRLKEESGLVVDAQASRGRFVFAASGTANDEHWPEAALLDLRISSMYASLFGGGLEVTADSSKPQLRLELPLTGS